jgi:hypothetical protein
MLEFYVLMFIEQKNIFWLSLSFSPFLLLVSNLSCWYYITLYSCGLLYILLMIYINNIVFMRSSCNAKIILMMVLEKLYFQM